MGPKMKHMLRKPRQAGQVLWRRATPSRIRHYQECCAAPSVADALSALRIISRNSLLGRAAANPGGVMARRTFDVLLLQPGLLVIDPRGWTGVLTGLANWPQRRVRLV